MGLQGYAMDYRGIKGIIWVYKNIQEDYRGIQGYTRDYRFFLKDT